jgi:phospholipid transport system substrate-binding protein
MSEAVLSIFTNPSYSEEEKERLASEIVSKFFDVQRISASSFSAIWSKVTEQERSELTKEFSCTVFKRYYLQISQKAEGAIVKCTKQIMKTDRAIVYTEIIRPTGIIPVSYSLFLSDKGWKIYDIEAEGVKLVANYRAQFDTMKKCPVSEIIKRLREKRQELENKT